ncbi:MAG: hypothetical protein M3354_02655, partial [Chloroflexota bacterium]|nr:hypothetical protein [Chloroflexota bacterium]
AVATSAAAAAAAARAAEMAQATAAAEVTAQNQATANAQATADVFVILTQTASTRPTETPLPVATPAPWTLAGQLISRGPDGIVVAPNDAAAPATRVGIDPAATILRDGQPATLDTLSDGDRVTMTVDGTSNLVTDLSAESVAASPVSRLTKLLWFLPLALVVPVFFWLRGRNAAAPFIVKRIDASSG